MSENLSIEKYKEIKLSDITLYAYETNISSQRRFIQNMTASGNAYFTNNALYANEIELKSRISSAIDYDIVTLYFENALANKTPFNFNIGDIAIKNAYIKKINTGTKTDNAFLSIDITFITCEKITSEA